MDFNQAGVILKSLLPWRLTVVAAVVLSTIASSLSAQSQDLPTVVSNVKVEPSPFSPNGDGKNEFTKFSFSLSEPSTVSVEIIFYSQYPEIGGQSYFINLPPEEITIGGETKTIYPSSIYTDSEASGLVEFFWDGTLSEGWSGLLPDTTYTFLIRVEDLDTDDVMTSLPVTGQVIIDKLPPAIYDISATPDPFSPNDDGIKDFATISFKLSGIPQVEEIGFIGFYLTLPDAEGNRFFELDPSSTHSGIYDPNVSVTIQTGPVPLEFIKRSNNSADFTFQVSGRRILDSQDTLTVLTGPITIAAADPLGKLYRDPQQQKFSFITQVVGESGSNEVDESNIVQVRTSAVELKVDIRNSFNEPVTTLDPQFVGGREYSATLGPQLDDDIYKYIITAADQAGNQVEASGSITAMSNPISITDLVINPDTISPADSNALYDFANISFRLTRSGRANIQIFRDSTIFVSNNLVRTLMSDTLLEAGGQTLLWDGRSQEGDFVVPDAQKAYRVIISAFDPVNFEQTEARGLIYVDNRAPPELSLNRLPTPTQVAGATVTGITEPDVRVQPYLNGTTPDSLRSDPVSGLFAFELTLAEGLNLVNSLAYDRVENGPTYSDTLRLVLDTQPPLVIDTLIYVAGEARRLLGALLLSFGPTDTIEVRLSDGVQGQVSGLKFQATSLRITAPNGLNLDGSMIFLSPDRVRFVPAQQITEEGTYILRVSAEDSLGNKPPEPYPVAFSIGAASTGPTLEVTTPDPALFLSPVIPERPWIFTAGVTDNSGTGINPQASRLELFSVTADTLIAGISTADDQGNLSFEVTEVIATDGSMDGEFELRVLAEDNDPASGTLTATIIYFYDTRRPDTLTVYADSARVAVTLDDPSPGSGIDLLKSSIVVSFQGQPVASARYTNDGDSTLFADFDSPLSAAGTYTIEIIAVDRAGNTRWSSASFTVGALGPPVIVQASSLFGEAARAEDLSQPISLNVQVQDNSGTGLDWENSTLTLIGPDSVEIDGEISRQENVLEITAGSVLSNSGADDGTYRLYVHIEDLSPISANLDTSFFFIYDNLPPDTTAVTFAPDTSSISIELTDLPAVAGRVSSGLDILTGGAVVTDPDGGSVEIELTHDGQSTITLTFTGGKPTAAGIYTVDITAADRAGNLLAKSFSFPLNIFGSIEFFPPDSSVVRGPLARITAAAIDSTGIFTPGPNALLRVIHRGLGVQGTSSVDEDTLVFTLADSLPTDGRSDGLYEVTVEMDIAAMGDQSSGRAFFTVDNLAPDTVSVLMTQTADGVMVRAEFTDGGDYPYVADIDRSATKMTFEDPGGRELVPVDTLWQDENTLEARFSPFESIGMHTLQLVVADRAGWTVTRTRILINTRGLAEGASVAFVEEVPARTSARINYIAGRADNPITKAILRIFNLRGDLIRRVDVSDLIDPAGSSVTAEWLLDNDRGKLVMNGVFIYYWEITFADGRRDKVRKTLAVARR